MPDYSDSEGSAPNYSSPDDGDYNTSDDDIDIDDYNNDDDDDDNFAPESLDSEDEKTKAVREGFSLHATDSPDTPAGKNNRDQWLSTQPASQSSIPSATKNKRISPRRKASGGITSAIVGVIRGEKNIMNNLVIPKKQKFRQKQQQQQQQAATEQTQQQQQQQPLKKRKVSLSPTDSLAKQRQVIDLLADDDDDDDDLDLDTPPFPKAFASKRSRTGQDPTQSLSPALLAAAHNQQKVHIAATKQKQKYVLEENERKKTYSSRNKEKTKPKPKPKLSSRVSEVSHAAKSGGEPSNGQFPSTAPSATDPLPPYEIPKAERQRQRQTNSKKVPAVAAAAAPSSTKVKSGRSKSNTKNDDLPPKSSKVEGTNPETTKTAVAVVTKSKTAATKSKAKTATVAKTNDNATAAVKTTQDAAPKIQATKAAAAKPPPKKKKKKRTTFEDELLQKIFLSCRPYSIKDLIQLMGKTASEASINFCLLSLIDKNWVIKKEFKSGSRTKELYWANQESKDKKLWALECLQLPDMGTIREGRLELAALQQRHKNVAREIETAERTPTNQQLSMRCQNAQKEMDDLRAKLEAMQGRIASSSALAPKVGGRPKKLGMGGGANGNRFGGRTGPFGKKSQPPKKAATPLKLKKNVNAMRDQWIKRKRKCMDFVDALADGMEKKVKDVVKKVLELETDEIENVTLPPKHII